MTHKIIHNDCLFAMKEIEDNSIDFIVTDSPYGISFMSKHWDQQIPPPEYWKEMLRICKPGSYMACAGLPRMMHRLTSIVEDSGWIIRDMIIHIFGSGFPKSNNFGKKLGESWNGYGTALKPAWEGWTLAMKPVDGTFAQNAEKWGVAGINIDSSRIGIKGATKRTNQADYPKNEDGTEDRSINWARVGHDIEKLNNGRWPSNLILDEESAEQLDKMTGNLKSTGGQGNYGNSIYGNLDNKLIKKDVGYNDSGGASRFFYCAKASSSERNKGLEGITINQNSEHRYGRYRCKKCNKLKLDHNPCICAEPEFERIETNQNTHPTVKPISLMKYIITLLAPPGNPICLDPFMGSGSTGVACKELGISFIGIEKEKEYVEIATKRLDTAQYTSQKQMEMFNGME